jgi:beta-lactamase superfamily II metal-dependent hydrolase
MRDRQMKRDKIEETRTPSCGGIGVNCAENIGTGDNRTEITGWSGSGNTRNQRGTGRQILSCVLLCVIVLAAFLLALYQTRHSDNRWTVTSYAPANGEQGTFYTITDNNNRLVIVDGGYDSDAQQVLNILKQHNYHVDAWIITHPHPDHAGAFNAIMSTYPDTNVTIDHIYTTKINRKRYEETAHDYDGIDTYYTFDSLTQKMNNVSYLKAGDELDLIGLHMKVLHAWDEATEQQQATLLNDGSLMFRVSGRKSSMLFCADVQSEMEDEIISSYSKDLKSDYVECGHHGNWGLDTRFYDLVDPKAAFMDCPDQILNDTTGTYDAPQLKSYFEERGVTVYSFHTSPNHVVLQ